MLSYAYLHIYEAATAKTNSYRAAECTEFGIIINVDQSKYGSTHYTLCLKKNDTDVAGYIFNAHQPILIVFGR